MLSVVLNELAVDKIRVLKCRVIHTLVTIILVVFLHIEKLIERFKQVLAIFKRALLD